MGKIAYICTGRKDVQVLWVGMHASKFFQQTESKRLTTALRLRRCPQGVPMCEEPQNEQQWYAIRVTYSREMAAKSYLDSIGIESYVPMHFAERTYGGKRRKVWEPLIHNLLFVRTSADRLRKIKATTTLPIRYIMDRESKSPTVIPERQMQDFMAVAAGRGSGKGRSGTRHGGHVRRNRRPLHPPQGTQQGRRGDPQRRNRPDGLYSAEIHRKDRLTIRSNIHT